MKRQHVFQTVDNGPRVLVPDDVVYRKARNLRHQYSTQAIDQDQIHVAQPQVQFVKLGLLALEHDAHGTK